jgi:hypothetical protein
MDVSRKLLEKPNYISRSNIKANFIWFHLKGDVHTKNCSSRAFSQLISNTEGTIAYGRQAWLTADCVVARLKTRKWKWIQREIKFRKWLKKVTRILLTRIQRKTDRGFKKKKDEDFSKEKNLENILNLAPPRSESFWQIKELDYILLMSKNRANGHLLNNNETGP